MPTRLLKHSFIWILFIFLLFVAVFSIVPSLNDFKKDFRGDSQTIKYSGFSKKSLQSHDFQKYTETLFEKNIRLRKKIVTFNNQLYYTLFKKSVANSTVIIGKHDQLYELSYILSYCNTTKELSKL